MLKSPFQFFGNNEESVRKDERNRLIASEVNVIMQALVPLLSRLGEVVIIQNIPTNQISLDTPSGVTFGVINRGNHQEREFVIDLRPTQQPQSMDALKDMLESILKDLNKKKK